MSERDWAQIAFMPYAPIKKGISVANWEVWPYYEECEHRIKDPTVIEHLDKLFGRYYDRKYEMNHGGYDEISKQVFVLTPRDFIIGKDRFSDRQIDNIYCISHILAFTAITEHFSSRSTDSFAVYLQNFRLGSEGITIWNKHFTRLEMVKFIKPYHLDISFFKYEKTLLCEKLGQALGYKDRNQVRRIFRTLELFFHTATYGEMVTSEQRILSLVMAFEVLLNFKDKYDFANKLEELLDIYNPVYFERTVKSKGERKLKHTKTGWWAIDLYNMRNDIVHGNNYDWEFEKYGSVWTRIQFGGTLLRKLIKRLLLKESLWESSIGDNIFEASSLDEDLDALVNEFRELNL